MHTRSMVGRHRSLSDSQHFSERKGERERMRSEAKLFSILAGTEKNKRREGRERNAKKQIIMMSRKQRTGLDSRSISFNFLLPPFPRSCIHIDARDIPSIHVFSCSSLRGKKKARKDPNESRIKTFNAFFMRVDAATPVSLLYALHPIPFPSIYQHIAMRSLHNCG